SEALVERAMEQDLYNELFDLATREGRHS
ncbi:hypothetical protein PPOP_3473, partial [Paenibacillus popilliae ATCC 14706]